MESKEIRKKFLKFFEKRGHKIIPSASLVPENDPTVLFTTAGMQPLVPYLLGETHPAGKRLVNIQKCLRTDDINEVGDNTHLTFFEMLGNWSLGDYFKEEAIKWSYELLTSKGEGFGLDPKRLYISVFEGDEKAPRDNETAEIWKKYLPPHRIYYLPANKNWWSPGDTGPAGPDSEMFYDITEKGLGDLTLPEYKKADEKQEVVEIWNDVFMQYEQKDKKVVGKLKNNNVDTGAGFERVAVVLQGKNNVFDTDLFTPILNKIDEFTQKDDLKPKRIIADHIRAAVFLIADGIIPSNTDRGYVLRRLIRRAVLKADKLGMKHGVLFWIAQTVIEMYQDVYPELQKSADLIKTEIDEEEQNFRKTLEKGIPEFRKMINDARKISGPDIFILFSSYGLPLDFIKELAQQEDILIDEEGFIKLFKDHQNLSRKGSEKKFKGGLADTSEMSVKYHTATHLLNAALRQILGKEVMQKGSNITPERLRFDFTYPRKLTYEEMKRVEDLVNEKIKEDLQVSFKEMPKEEAEKTGAVHAFGEKYGDMVKVYSIGDKESGYFSQEFCGGPHVEHTGLLGHFRITKEEAVSAGVRRIKAILE